MNSARSTSSVLPLLGSGPPGASLPSADALGAEFRPDHWPEPRMDPDFLERLVKRHTEPLERRLRDLEAFVHERLPGPELSLVTSDSDDEPTCTELVLGRSRTRKSTLNLAQAYERPKNEMLPRVVSPSASPLNSPRNSLQPTELAPGERPVDPQPIDPDVFGMTLVSLIDCFPESQEDHQLQGLHYAQFFFAFFLFTVALGVQIGVLYETKHLVTPHPVADIRTVYDQFEIVMYGNNIDRMQLTANGKHRGYPEYFQPELFNTLSLELQSKACRIPFSQPLFFFIICFIWSSTCVAEIKQSTMRFTCLIWRTKTSRSMTTRFRGRYPAGERVIQELTIPVKLIITFLLLLPRLLLTMFLLWLGCRWLAATDSFAGLIWNVVAMEFVISIKFLIYEALSPLRANLAVEHTKMMPPSDKVENSYRQLYGTIVWTTLAVAWVWCYMHYFQKVLPDYRWDVHEVCATWIKSNVHE